MQLEKILSSSGPRQLTSYFRYSATLTLNLAFYLTHILALHAAFCLAFHPAYILTVYSALFLAFYLTFVLAFFVSFHPAYLLAFCLALSPDSVWQTLCLACVRVRSGPCVPSLR